MSSPARLTQGNVTRPSFQVEMEQKVIGSGWSEKENIE